MSIRRALLVLGCLMIMLLPCAAHAITTQNSVELSYTLTSLGGDDYLYTFVFTNTGPNPDGIFKIQITNLPDGVTTIGTTQPTGWSGDERGGKLEFTVGSNGSLPNHGIDRIFGQSSSPYGTVSTTGTFTWEFTSATPPSADQFSLDDFTIHLQPLGGDRWANQGTSYPVKPTPEPSGLLALAGGLTGLGGLMWRRRK